MSLKRTLNALTDPDDVEVVRMSYPDRAIVALFMTLTVALMAMFLDAHATPAEQAAALEPIVLGQTLFDILGLLAFWVLIAPVARFAGRVAWRVGRRGYRRYVAPA